MAAQLCSWDGLLSSAIMGLQGLCLHSLEGFNFCIHEGDYKFFMDVATGSVFVRGAIS